MPKIEMVGGSKNTEDKPTKKNKVKAVSNALSFLRASKVAVSILISAIPLIPYIIGVFLAIYIIAVIIAPFVSTVKDWSTLPDPTAITSTGTYASGGGISSSSVVGVNINKGPGAADITVVSSVTADILNKRLRGVLAGHGQDYITVGHKNGIDPAFLAAISANETLWGTSSMAVDQLNVGGLTRGTQGAEHEADVNSATTGSRFLGFMTVQGSIFTLGDYIKRYYIDNGRKTEVDIASSYAPIPAICSDPVQRNSNQECMNSTWVSTVYSIWKQFIADLPVVITRPLLVGSFQDGNISYPLLAGVVTQNYYEASHHGVDIAEPRGTPVYSATDGVVTLTNGKNAPCMGNGGGNAVIVTTKSGWQMRYLHLKNAGADVSSDATGCDGGGIAVSVNDTVHIGDIIGYTGRTSDNFPSPEVGLHLHFSVISPSGLNVDPMTVLPYTLREGDSIKNAQ
jgi:hypothetical protein